jgi:hypothetical protein
MQPFVVFALPRSRTAWMSRYLSYDGRFLVGHDIAARSDSIEGFFRNFDEGLSGTVETGAMMGWRLFRERFPDAPIAVVRRSIEDVKLSLARFGVAPREGDLEARAAVLDELEKEPGVLSVTFRDLCEARNRRRVFEHCLGCAWDQEWDARLASVDIQVDFMRELREVAVNQERIAAMKRVVEAHFLVGLHA